MEVRELPLDVIPAYVRRDFNPQLHKRDLIPDSVPTASKYESLKFA